MSETKHSFWGSVPGILTGLAAVITASGTIYLATDRIGGNDQGRVVDLSPPPHVARPFSHTDWPSIATETFTGASTWTVGSFSDEHVNLDLRNVDGKYRWDLQLRGPWERWIESPYGPAVDFYVAVDARLIATTAQDPQISLLFGRASNQDYGFTISQEPANTYFGLKRYDGTNNDMVIAWMPTLINAEQTNRLAVLVENQTIKLFLNDSPVGEYRDPTFTGGKFGLAVAGQSEGSAVVEFDNFEFRRKPT